MGHNFILMLKRFLSRTFWLSQIKWVFKHWTNLLIYTISFLWLLLEIKMLRKIFIWLFLLEQKILSTINLTQFLWSKIKIDNYLNSCGQRLMNDFKQWVKHSCFLIKTTKHISTLMTFGLQFKVFEWHWLKKKLRRFMPILILIRMEK